MKRRRTKRRNPGGIGGADIMGALAGFAASYALAELGGRGLPIQLRGPLAGVPAAVLGGMYAAKEGASHPSYARGACVGGVGFGAFAFYVNKQAQAAQAAGTTPAQVAATAQGQALLAQAQAMNKPASSQPAAQPVNNATQDQDDPGTV